MVTELKNSANKHLNIVEGVSVLEDLNCSVCNAALRFGFTVLRFINFVFYGVVSHVNKYFPSISNM